MTLLSRAQLLAAPVATKDVEIPGGIVRVRALSPRLRAELLDAITANARAVEDYEDDQKLPAKDRKGVAKAVYLDQSVLAVMFSLIDDAGDLLFTIADYDQVCDLSLPVVEKLWLAARELEKPVNPTALKKSLKAR